MCSYVLFCSQGYHEKPQVNQASLNDWSVVGHLWVTFCLSFKTSLCKLNFSENDFHLYENEHAGRTHFYMVSDSFSHRGKKQIGNGLIATIFSILRAELHVPQVNDSLW